MLSVPDPIKKQLVRAKFVLEIGLAPHLARHSEADNVIAIILLDYCIEGILKTILTAASASTSKKEVPFHELWRKANEVIADAKHGISIAHLPLNVDMANLHGLRNDTQHAGRTPNDVDVERDVVVAREFARQVYQDLFGIDYQTLSLVDLVRNKKLRECLKEAERLLDEGKWQESAISSAEAMERLMKIGEAYSPLEYPQRLYGLTDRVKEREVSGALDKLGKSVEELREAVSLQMQVVMGLDLKNYKRYRHYAPRVIILMNDSADSTFMNEDLTAEHSKWVFDYVLGNVLRMEEAGLEWTVLG